MNIINPGQLLPLLVVTLINILIMEMFRLGHKKRRGAKFLSIAYPNVQAFALPLPKDKQPKALPTPSDIYKPTTSSYIQTYIYQDTLHLWGVTPYLYI